MVASLVNYIRMHATHSKEAWFTPLPHSACFDQTNMLRKQKTSSNHHGLVCICWYTMCLHDVFTVRYLSILTQMCQRQLPSSMVNTFQELQKENNTLKERLEPVSPS